jgi:hypothetical protein
VRPRRFRGACEDKPDKGFVPFTHSTGIAGRPRRRGADRGDLPYFAFFERSKAF